VRSLLTGEGVLATYAPDTRGGRTIQLRECPRCKCRQRRPACKGDRDTGVWIHHSGPGGVSPPASVGTRSTGVTGYQGPTR